MPKTFKISGHLLMNTSSIQVDESGSVYLSDEPIDYGYPPPSGSFMPPIAIADIVDQKPCVAARQVIHTFDNVTDLTGSWSWWKNELDDGLATLMVSASHMSQSHFEEVYTLAIEDTEATHSFNTNYDTGSYYKYRHFEDEVLTESYLVPATSSEGPYVIPPWS